MKAQLVKGHGLLNEGAGYPPGSRDLVRRHMFTWQDPKGIAGCRCGATSPPLPSNNARKKWHRTHKAEVVAG